MWHKNKIYVIVVCCIGRVAYIILYISSNLHSDDGDGRLID